MKIHLVKPFGYCSGVVHAMDMALHYASTHKEEEIYLLGMLVHNEDSVASLTRLGVHILDEKKEDLETQLKNLPDGVTLLFSAHGHPSHYEEIAKEKHIKTIDTTCRFVKENEANARKEYQHSEDIIYIGSKGHLESEGFLANLPRVSFFDVKTNSLMIRGDISKPSLYCQTTLGMSEIERAISEIQKHFKDAKLIKGRCHATSLRQDALMKTLEKEKVDCLLVLGSSTSNNSKKLAEIGLRFGIDSYLCLNIHEVRKLDFSKYTSIAVATGASTSRQTALEVIDYLSLLSASQRDT